MRKFKKSIAESPRLLAEWDYGNNVGVNPKDISIALCEKIWWKCSVKEHLPWKATPNSRSYSNSNCPECAKKTKNQLIKVQAAMKNPLSKYHDIASEFHPTKNGDLTPDMIAAKSNYKIWWKCKKKNHEYEATAGSRTSKNGTGCPICSESKGEKRVREILKEKNIDFIQEYKDQSCRHKNMLLFDFAIIKNGNIIAMIEYHGEQHYFPHNFGSKKKTPEENLDSIKKRDNIKKQWCISNNILLLEIPYNDFDNIKEILNDFLIKNRILLI